MGREVRRVPLNFTWPIDETWDGFLNPHYDACRDCDSCGGTGYSPDAKRFSDEWYGNQPFDYKAYGVEQISPYDEHLRKVIEAKILHSDKLVEAGEYEDNYYLRGFATRELAVAAEIARMWNYYRKQWLCHLNQDDVDALVEAGRLFDFTHHWTRGDGWQPNDPATPPAAEAVNRWALSSMGHDSINCSVCVEARCKREGVSIECEACAGEASIWESPEAKELAEAWEKADPPSGEGYQLWETVSEGSPVTPVFTTPRELAEWLVKNDDSVTADTTLDQWIRFIEGPGWAPTAVSENGRFKSGTKAVGTVESDA